MFYSIYCFRCIGPKPRLLFPSNEVLTQRLGACYIILISFYNLVRLLILPVCDCSEWILPKFTDEAHSRSIAYAVPKRLTVRTFPTVISTSILTSPLIVRLSGIPGSVVERLACRSPNPRTIQLPLSRGMQPRATVLQF